MSCAKLSRSASATSSSRSKDCFRSAKPCTAASRTDRRSSSRKRSRSALFPMSFSLLSSQSFSSSSSTSSPPANADAFMAFSDVRAECSGGGVEAPTVTASAASTGGGGASFDPCVVFVVLILLLAGALGAWGGSN